MESDNSSTSQQNKCTNLYSGLHIPMALRASLKQAANSSTPDLWDFLPPATSLPVDSMIADDDEEVCNFSCKCHKWCVHYRVIMGPEEVGIALFSLAT